MTWKSWPVKRHWKCPIYLGLSATFQWHVWNSVYIIFTTIYFYITLVNYVGTKFFDVFNVKKETTEKKLRCVDHNIMKDNTDPPKNRVINSNDSCICFKCVANYEAAVEKKYRYRTWYVNSIWRLLILHPFDQHQRYQLLVIIY